MPSDVRDRVLYTELALLAAFCGFLFFFGAGAFGLAGADEPRYAQVAREMLGRHDWITPVLNGQPWLEKPVLYYWEAMIAFRLFGVSEWAARMPSAASGTAMVAAIYFFMRSMVRGFAETASEASSSSPSSETPLDAALITASSVAVFGFAHGASTDMPLAANFTIGMLAWFAWRCDGRKMWLAAFYFFMALGMLAKGPIAPALASIIIVVFAAFRRDARLVLRTAWLPGIALFLAVALPWYLAVEASTHQFFRVFFLEHNLARFGTNLYRHPQPFWYYLPVLLLSLMPWTVFAVAALVRVVRRLRQPAGTSGQGPDDLSLFLVIWAAVPVVFFSFSQSKLPGYILPAIPAWTLLLAVQLRQWTAAPKEDSAGENARQGTGKSPGLALLVVHALLSAALTYGVVVLPYVLLRVAQPRLALVLAAVTAVAVFLAVTLTVRRQGLRMLRFVTLVPLVLAFGFVVRIAGPAIDATQSARPIAHTIAELGVEAGAPVAVFNASRSVEYGLNFYRNQPIAHYDKRDVPSVAPDHLIVAREGSAAELKTMLAGRRVVRVGSFSPQRLEFFWVTSASHAQAHGTDDSITP